MCSCVYMRVYDVWSALMQAHVCIHAYKSVCICVCIYVSMVMCLHAHGSSCMCLCLCSSAICQSLSCMCRYAWSTFIYACVCRLRQFIHFPVAQT